MNLWNFPNFIFCPGTMDASAFVSSEDWQKLLEKLRLDEESICEGRYDHIVHMVPISILILKYPLNILTQTKCYN